MFSVELYALLSETVAGTGAVTAILLGVWAFYDRGKVRFVDWLRKHIDSILRGKIKQSGRSTDLGKARELLFYPLGVAIVLALGLAVQGVVDDAVDRRPVGLPVLTTPIQAALQTKDAYRFSALYKLNSENSWMGSFLPSLPSTCSPHAKRGYALTSLGKEILLGQRQLMARFLPPAVLVDGQMEHGCTFRADSGHRKPWCEFLRSPGSFLDWTLPSGHLPLKVRRARCEVAMSISLGLYYDGNNWAMSNETAAAALRRWQIQSDTLGSIALSSFIVVLVTAPFLVAWFLRESAWSDLEQGEKSAILWMVGGLIVSLLCSFGYVVGMKAYTSRAVGMYLSFSAHSSPEKFLVNCETMREFLGPDSYAVLRPPVCAVAERMEKSGRESGKSDD